MNNGDRRAHERQLFLIGNEHELGKTVDLDGSLAAACAIAVCKALLYEFPDLARRLKSRRGNDIIKMAGLAVARSQVDPLGEGAY